jgi:serine protease Do
MPRSMLRTKVCYLLLGAVATLVFLAGSFSLGRLSAEMSPTVIAPHPAFAQSSVDGKTVSVADIAERSMASVVNISSVRRVRHAQSPFTMDPFFRELFRQFGPADPSPRFDRSLGSGVIVSADGLVLTNNHVIADSERIRVLLSNKREVEAKVIGTDPKSDVAVLRLQGVRGLRPIALGDSDRARLGDVVLAIGNPFGVGQTVTMGIISAKGRANMGIVDYEDFIQTDAAINPGNSGGALVNMRGELIGINTAILSRTGGYQGVGFAIPTNMVRPIMTSLIKHGKVMRGWLGVTIQDVDADLAKAMKLPTRQGVLIADVSAGGPAARAALRRGDLVVKINGQGVDSSGKLRNLIAAAGVSGRARVDFYRDGRLQSVTVVLGELPANLVASAGSPGSGGLSVAPLSPAARSKFSIPTRVNAGVVIDAVQPGGAAAQAGLQAGDVILEVNRATIASVSRFSQIFSAASGQVLLLVYRRGGTYYTILNK